MTAKFCPLNLTPEEIIEYTPEWEGDRSEDGRPRVADEILERMREVTTTQAWGVIRGQGYEWAFEGDWMCTHPDGVLVGRALTAMYQPRRPVMRKVMEAKGEAAARFQDEVFQAGLK